VSIWVQCLNEAYELELPACMEEEDVLIEAAEACHNLELAPLKDLNACITKLAVQYYIHSEEMTSITTVGTIIF